MSSTLTMILQDRYVHVQCRRECASESEEGRRWEERERERQRDKGEKERERIREKGYR